MEIRQSREWGVFLESLGWRSEYIKTSQIEVAVRIKPLLGITSALKIQRPEIINEEVLENIRKIAKKNRAFLTKIEPFEDVFVGSRGTCPPTGAITPLQKFGFHKDSWPMLPPKTVVIDLMPSEEEILAKFSKDGRYCLRRAQKSGLFVSVGVASTLRDRPAGEARLAPTELDQFYGLFEETSKRGHFYAPSLKELTAKINAFGDKALLFIASASTVGARCIVPLPIAGALVLIHDHTAVYLHAASSSEGQKLEAPYLLIWEIIKKAKLLGCTSLDLEGIYDERFPGLTKKWQGFTVFKRKFGGEEISYPGAYSRYL